jgi:hypothetical protein
MHVYSRRIGYAYLPLASCASRHTRQLCAVMHRALGFGPFWLFITGAGTVPVMRFLSEPFQ